MLIYAPGKKAARLAAAPQLRANRDQLYAATCRMIVLHCMPGGEAQPERMTQAMLDYLARKHAALKAAYFRQLFGRDYWTGRPRRITRSDRLDAYEALESSRREFPAFD